jgi:DNA-binding NarL/FixJ family response regulator
VIHHLLAAPGALKLVRLIERDAPNTRTIVIGVPDCAAELLSYIEVGADGYVCDGHTSQRLLESIRAAYRGQALIDPSIAAALMRRAGELQRQLSFATRHFLDGAATLTRRELDVLELMRLGLTNEDIAKRLFIEVGTAKNHVQSVLRKLNVNRRREAARYAGLVSALHTNGTLSPLS